ncbi:MAG: 1,4-beta-xylanase [Bacteroidetes bacterium GWF2_42_66]|nr:MAG: 1,4-beta-xylanase [Bacteroidetes bacterium GWE2_42_39]OFY42126.1 MAG: 1,4-beta-xylanase [Bacteroidetes bacterium GWF2_42_66]
MQNQIRVKFSIRLVLIMMVLGCGYLPAQTTNISNQQKAYATQPLNKSVMSEAYWKLWNPEVQAKIDRDIEQNRKVDAVCKLKDIKVGTEVKVEQISHDFIFGAHIFNYNQLGTTERNQKYKDLFGSLFNSATIAFYWKKFEMQPNRPRFKEEFWDTEVYWNNVKEPKKEPHWRRPASDPVVEFCESKGIRLHGHTMIWGNRTWQHPEWLFDQFCPSEEKEKINRLNKDGYEKLTPLDINELAPVYVKEMKRLFEKRIAELINYYGGRLQSWDVVNESAVDYHGQCVTGDAVCKSAYGLMPGDYTYNSFNLADQMFPKSVKLNINDYANNANYANQTKDMLAHGCRIDIMGSQMHLFNPQQCLDVADGKLIESPMQVWDKMEIIGKAGLPIHLSEITITSPGDDERGREIQAIIARNLYRLWFSIKPMMGITWWNVVDDCGAPGEPSVSGLFNRNMEPKPSFYALDQLINQEWKTNTSVKSGENGIVKFRGFKGRYRISWKDKSGKEQQADFYLKKDGDGL